jgi:hypothetical protein
MTTRKLAFVIVRPGFIDVDEDGEVENGPYHLAHPQTQQPIEFTVSAKQWKAGWSLDDAVKNVDAQLAAMGVASGDVKPNRAARRKAIQLKKTVGKPTTRKAAKPKAKR